MNAITVAGEFGVSDRDLEDGNGVEARVLDAARGIVGRLETLAQQQVSSRQMIEQRWLEDLRNYYGRYDETTEADLKEAKRSRAFVKLTRHKTNSWAARLSDLLFPTDDRNWGVDPTPLPRLVQAAKEAIEAAKATVDRANQTAAAGDAAAAETLAEQADSYAQAAKQTESEVAEAKRRAERMQEAIEDQLVESRYPVQCRDVIEDGCRLGTGILKGPLTSNRLRAEWRQGDGEGGWQLAQIPDPQPEFVRVDPWHFFPDMSARTIAEAEFSFERSLPTKKDLKRHARKLGFNKAAVRRLLQEGPKEGQEANLSHIAELREMTGEGEPVINRYVQWEYHGPLECDEIAALLRATGNEEAAKRHEELQDPLEEYRVIIHFCQNEVLKIAADYPLDSGDSLYSVWNFEKGETSVFGVGVPHIMGDSQAAVNGAWRMMMDNSGLSVGPQIVIDKEKVTPQDGSYKLSPLKIWLASTSALATPQNPPFQVYNIPNNQQQLAGIIELGKMFIDEETSMPLIAQGEAGASVQPVGTTSMLFNSANVVFRRIVKSWDDDLTTPTIRRAYDWNMQFNPDDSIKGDMQVDARGTSVLLVREIQSQNLMAIITNWPAHPILGPYVKVRAGMVKTLQTLMIPPDELLFTDDEAKQNAAAMAPPPEEAPVDSRLQVAELESDTRLQLAEIQRDIKLMELAQRENLTVEQLRTQLDVKRIETASKERLRAADIAVEEQRAARAMASGTPTEDAVGQGVG